MLVELFERKSWALYNRHAVVKATTTKATTVKVTTVKATTAKAILFSMVCRPS